MLLNLVPSVNAVTTSVRPRASHVLRMRCVRRNTPSSGRVLGSSTSRPCVAVGAYTDNSTSTSRDTLKTELKALEAERDTAIQTAESCSKTATKLAEMARLLEQLALEKVSQQDESGARQALQEKAAVMETLDKNSAKADVNYKLAAVLASKISTKQSQLLSQLRASGNDQQGSTTSSYSSPSYSSPASSPGYSSSSASSGYSSSYSSSDSTDGPKWKWQQSLEEAKERLKSQEAAASRDGRMAKLSAEASILEAKQRISSQASQSIRDAQERLRAMDSNSQNTIAAAQARLRMRDEEVLKYVRRIMARYRAGEYVSEDELEFAFRQLEKRFIL